MEYKRFNSNQNLKRQKGTQKAMQNPPKADVAA